MAKAMRSGQQDLSPSHEVRTTLGELIAAAFDTLGNRADDVAAFLASSELRRATGERIVLQ